MFPIVERYQVKQLGPILEQDLGIFYRCVEDCGEPIMITNTKGELVYVNPAWSRVYGYSFEEAIGRTPRLLRSAEQDDDFYRAMWSQISNSQIGFWKGELVNRAKDGRLVTVVLTITPYKVAGKIVGYMGIALDMTSQKKMESALIQQEHLAGVGMLASGLAHEIGTPLGVIRGRAEMLMMSTDEEKQKTSLNVIIQQIDRISKLIRSLLRVGRTQENVNLSSVSLKSCVSEVVNLVSETCARSGIQIDAAIPENLRVHADPSLLHQVLLNLVINSVHAIETQVGKTQGGVHKHSIQLTVHERGTFVDVHIKDTGCGITRENIKKLFQPFFTTKDVGVGTGLGLAIVAKLVSDMKGSIRAESDGEGSGANFTLSLGTVF